MELTGLGWSFEHPTAKEQTIRSAAKDQGAWWLG